MVKKRMAMRMVTIFVALIVCGMFFPGLARGVSLTSDKGFDVTLEGLQLNEESKISVEITNEGSANLRLLLQLEMDGGCGFVYEGPSIGVFYPDVPVSVVFKYTPSDYGECGAKLRISDMEDVDSTGKLATVAVITLTAVLEEETAEEPKYISVGEIETEVEDRSIEIDQDRISTLQEMIDYCKDEFERHDLRRGKLVRCIAWTTGELKKEGSLDYREMSELRKAAAKVEWQTMIQKMRARRETNKSSRGGHRFWWLCRDK
jgi:hypothetical protein